MESFKPIQGLGQQINPVQALSSPVSDLGLSGEENDDKKLSFANIMGTHVQAVNKTLHDSVQMKEKMIRGELQNTHEASIAGMKAGLMLKMTTAICSKVSSACTTLFQMQI
jgi:flagellar hook-basal body complex protein FliE